MDVDRKSMAFVSSDLRYIDSGLGKKNSEGSSPGGINQHTFFPNVVPIYAGESSQKMLQIKVSKSRIIHADENHSSNLPNRLTSFEEKNVRHTVLIAEKSTEQFSEVINSFMDSNQKR
jgi:hypothetical protein